MHGCGELGTPAIDTLTSFQHACDAAVRQWLRFALLECRTSFAQRQMRRCMGSRSQQNADA